MADLRVTRIVISVGKEELRDILARAGGCNTLEVWVEDIRTSRDGLGLAWVRCSTVLVGWSMARIEAIPKRPLRCYCCLELGHERVICGSNGRPWVTVLQVRRHRPSGEELPCLHAQVLALWVAWCACQPQNGRAGMCSLNVTRYTRYKNARYSRTR